MDTVEIIGDYKKYRWFFTLSGKLVVGGKSAMQNEELLKRLKRQAMNFTLMHTESPGSPFSVILSDKITKSDIEETAVFTGCFSREWKRLKKETIIHIFALSQLYKTKKMGIGTWAVKGKVERKIAPLELFLTKQKNILRAVPEKTLKTKKYLLKITPGKIDKKDILPKIQLEIAEHLNQEELLSALPSGGIFISKK